MRIWLLLVIGLNLAGCEATLQPVPDAPKEIRVPLAVPCIERADVPVATFATDAELAKLDDGQFVLRLARDRLERQGHIAKLEAVIQGCIKGAP